ncbi:MAG: transposase [Pyrinomonadaceae bacterium]|jgi:hypothetical protein|nr:transposase [Pyrinomonadaceae bacterium]MBA3716168.1 transposase [Pyrinomonadaceae bacterium]
MPQFTMLFEPFSSVFTAPSFLHFQALILSLWALPLVTSGPLSLSRIWLQSRTSAHWDALLRFVRSYAWEVDELARVLTLFVLAQVKHRLPRDSSGRRILLIGVDETGDDHHTARHMFGVSKHYNSSAKAGQSKYRIGHCWVTLSILIDVHAEYVRSLAINIALYIAKKSCQAEAYKSKRELATEMLDKLCQWVGQDYQIAVVGDRYYACREWIAEQRSKQRRVVTRLRADANLYELAAEPKKKKRGRKRIYGTKISLKHRARFAHKFEPECDVQVYGRMHRVRLRKIVCRWRGLTDPVSVVIVTGIGKKPFYLLDTDTEASAEQTLYFYAARHAVEQGYEDLKCDGGLGQYRGRTELGVRRFALLTVAAHTLLRLIELVPELRRHLPQAAEPWRKPKSHMTMGQIRLALNKVLLAEYARTGNFFKVGKQVEDEENCQRTETVLKKAA